MQNSSKPAAVLRMCSLLLLFSVPHRYLAGILPAAVLPLWALGLTAAVHFIHRKGIRAEAAWLSAFAAALIMPGIALGLLALIPQLIADTLYLRITLILGILAAASFLTVTAAVLFLYTVRWRRYEPLAAILLFSLLFLPQQHYRLTVFSNPLFAAGFAGMFMLLQISLLCESFIIRRRFILFFFLMLCLTAAMLISFTHFFNKNSVGNNGGLLEQKLFEFDFSQLLKLQDEVKMNTHLVMVVHVDQEYDSHLFRRMYLSGWDPQKGFYEKQAPGEQAQVLQLPKRFTEVPHQIFQCRETVSQEIFAVNFDPSSFVSLDYPLSITPYTVWDTASFKGAYKTESSVLHGVPLDLITAEPPSGNIEEGLSAEALTFYTAIDEETKQTLLPLAEALTADFALYYDKVYALLDYFREGEYRYSLHPGHAPDGDQLRYFVTESKKGYCSYFAFAYCLMLRSLGIPARVAAGFFLQPESGVLNYYPVRANMAHAWVEVFFPYIGWVDIDPTTEQLAEGESLDLSFQAGGDWFSALLDEILLNRSALRSKNEDALSASEAQSLTQRVTQLMRTYRIALTVFVLFCVLITLLSIRLYPHVIIAYSSNKRKIILTLGKLHPHQSEAFHALVQKAKFAPVCTDDDVKAAKQLYRAEKKRKAWKTKTAVKKEQPKRPRPEHCIDTAHRDTRRMESNDRHPPRSGVLMILVLFLLPLKLFPLSGADELLQKADTALQAENWDTAAALLEQGIAQYPANELFQLKLGDMYFNNGVYEPAYRCFTEGLRVNRYNIKLLYGAANAAAALNKEEEARQLLHEYLSYNPTDIFGWSTYGWLCFKTHRTEEGIQAMLDARSNYGDDGSIANALGNLYGELFDYDNATSYYRKGIALALQNNARYSASVYSYNKAILETEFYHFVQAEEDARNASDYFERASGYLILGELEERKNNFSHAIGYYVQSTEHNQTPLPLINLAKIYLRMGQWEHAERYIAQIERVTDHSWIANFGMSTAQFDAERYGLYRLLYEKKYAAERMRIAESIQDFFVRQRNLVTYSAFLHYYRALAGICNLKLAKEYRTADSKSSMYEFYKNSFYYRAFKAVPFKAKRYLQHAQRLETAVIPQAQASYTAEIGMLLRDVTRLERALQTLDPIWEQELREQTTAVLISCTRNVDLKKTLLKELLKNNPACFPEHWIKLPVTLACTALDEQIAKKTQQRLTAALKKSLFTVSTNAPFTLTAVCFGDTTKLSVIDQDGSVYFTYEHPTAITDRASAAACINGFAARLFRAAS